MATTKKAWVLIRETETEEGKKIRLNPKSFKTRDEAFDELGDSIIAKHEQFISKVVAEDLSKFMILTQSINGNTLIHEIIKK